MSRHAKRFVKLRGYRPDVALDGWPLDPNHRCIAGLNEGLRREPYGAEFPPAAVTISRSSDAGIAAVPDLELMRRGAGVAAAGGAKSRIRICRKSARAAAATSSAGPAGSLLARFRGTAAPSSGKAMQTASAGARAAPVGLWTPPPDELGRLEGRWARRGDYTTKLEAEGEIE